MHYPGRSTLVAALMITQSFLYNAIFFTYGLVLKFFFHVPATSVPATRGKADGQTRGQAGQRTCATDLPALIDVPGGSTSRPWCPAADQQPS